MDAGLPPCRQRDFPGEVSTTDFARRSGAVAFENVRWGRHNPGYGGVFRRRTAGGRNQVAIVSNRLKKWLGRTLAGLVLVTACGWLGGTWLIRSWIARPPPLP